MTAELVNQLFTPIIFAVFAAGFFCIWFQYRNLKSAGFLALSYISGAAAFTFEVALPREEETIILVVRSFGDIFYLLITFFFVIAAAYRYEQKVPSKTLGILFVGSVLANTWFWFGYESLTIRSYLISASCAVMLLMCIPIIRRQKMKLIDHALAWLLGISACQLVIQTITILHVMDGVKEFAFETYWQSEFLAYLNLSVAIISLALAVVLFVGLGMDIIAEYKRKSDTDVLSNVLNRRGFEEAAIRQISNASDHGVPVTLIIGDIDNFKSINDTYGHQIGDTVISNFSTIMKSACRKQDIIGRIGGEEFCILLPAATQEMGALVAESVRSSVKGFEHTDGKIPAFFITSSFGVAELRPGETYLSLFNRADKALYEAKEQGRDIVIRADKDEMARVLEFKKRLQS